jgi:uncharacterized protein YpiB (UPF0302 family)
MYKLTVVLVTVFFLSCSKKDKALHTHIANADSVAINFFKGDGTMDTVIAVKIIRDKNTMAQLAAMVSQDKVSSLNKCGVDGSLHFFKQDRVIQDIDFSLSNKQCQYFFYVYKGKRSNSRLPAEAVVLLQGIAAGK